MTVDESNRVLETLITRATGSVGCEHCTKVRIWDSEVSNSGLDCASAFHRTDFYFSANLVCCPECGAIWLLGYREDDQEDPLAEWGKRIFINQPLDLEHIRQIGSALGSGSLILDTFGEEHEGGIRGQKDVTEQGDP